MMIFLLCFLDLVVVFSVFGVLALGMPKTVKKGVRFWPYSVVYFWCLHTLRLHRSERGREYVLALYVCACDMSEFHCDSLCSSRVLSLSFIISMFHIGSHSQYICSVLCLVSLISDHPTKDRSNRFSNAPESVCQLFSPVTTFTNILYNLWILILLASLRADKFNLSSFVLAAILLLLSHVSFYLVILCVSVLLC